MATAAYAGPLPLGGLPQADGVNMDEFVFHDEALAQGERFYLKQPQKGSIVSVKKGNRGRKALAKKKKVAATRCGKGELNPRIFCSKSQDATPITTGSDCSGLDTLTASLMMAGLRLVAKFLTEKDAKTRQMLQSQFEHGGAYYTACDEFPRIDSDVMVRDYGSLESVDIYTARPPCQPYSAAGLQRGLQDGRGIVLLRVLQTIETTKPSSFALENVKPLASHKKNRPIFKFILAFLRDVKDDRGKPLYEVRWKAFGFCHLRFPYNFFTAISWDLNLKRMIIVFDDDASEAVLSRFSRRPWKGACLKDVAGLTLWDGRKSVRHWSLPGQDEFRAEVCLVCFKMWIVRI